MQLGVFQNLRLDEQCGLRGIKPDRKPVCCDLQSVFCYGRRVFVMRGQRVPIGDEEKTFVFFLKLQPIREGSEKMAEMKSAGRAHTAEDSFLKVSQPGELLRREIRR